MKTCSRCKRQYRDDSFNFCLDDGTPLTFDNRGSTTIRMPQPQPKECNRETLFSQAEVNVSPSEAKAIQLILDAAPHFGFSLKWGKGKTCGYMLQDSGAKKGSLLSINSKAELWLGKGVKGEIAAKVAESLQIDVPQFDHWFLIRSNDWVPKCGRLLHVLGVLAYEVGGSKT